MILKSNIDHDFYFSRIFVMKICLKTYRVVQIKKISLKKQEEALFGIFLYLNKQTAKCSNLKKKRIIDGIGSFHLVWIRIKFPSCVVESVARYP